MREVLFRVTRLVGGRAVRWWWLLVAGLGVALTALPLLGVPGYELSTGLALLLALPGGGLAVSLGRRQGYDVRDGLAAALVQASATLPALVVATAATALRTPCDPLAAFGFVPVIVLPTALLAAALGALLSRVHRAWRASLAWLGLVLLSALPTAWPLVAGPQVFAFNHLGGFLPGPLYDEELSVTAPLLWFRLATVLLGLGLLWWRAGRRFAGGSALALAVALELLGPRLGFRMTDEALADALGGRVEVDELVLHYPRALTDEEVSRILGDLRFRHRQLVDFFGAAPEGRVRVWWYASAAEKQRLVGAAHTQFAKPWRREIHVNGQGFPHPVIKHELVHALAAPWGARPFGVAATLGGLFPHVGVIEGLAVAGDDPVDELSLHEWAAAMKKRGLLPDVTALMAPGGFYRAPPSRAYTTAGSFLRWLKEAHGQAALRELARDGDFARATGHPLPELARAFEAFLDTVPVDPSAETQAFARFSRGSVFERPCAREVAALASRAAQAPADDALELLGRCRALQPREPAHALAEAQSLRRLGRLDEARARLDGELSRLEAEPSPWIDAAMARADLALELGDEAHARALWTRVLERAPSPTMDRTAHVRLAGLALPSPAREAVQRYFDAGAEELRLLRLQEARAAVPEAWPVRYLLGRRLAQLGEHASALEHLDAVLAAAVPESVTRETTRLALEAAFGLGRCDRVAGIAAAPRFGPTFTARARDWAARCAFAWPSP